MIARKWGTPEAQGEGCKGLKHYVRKVLGVWWEMEWLVGSGKLRLECGRSLLWGNQGGELDSYIEGRDGRERGNNLECLE